MLPFFDYYVIERGCQNVFQSEVGNDVLRKLLTVNMTYISAFLDQRTLL